MSAYIYNKLKQLMEVNSYPMHMPGHKRNYDFFPAELLKWDVTEVDGLDNLHHPDGIINDSQKALAETLGADNSYILVNGGSSGIEAAIMATVNPCEKILTASNCHKSIYGGLVLSGAKPIYISPKITEEGLCGSIAASDVYRAFNNNDIKAVIITSPTYEGFCCDIKVIADIVHKNNAILIVDECHGAHFPFSDKFPKTALELDADIVINSWHKTLPCPNQAAVLSVKSDRVDIQRLENSIHIVTTTSPSYPIMASIDYMRDLLTKDKNLMLTYTETLIQARKLISHCKSLKLIGDNFKGKCAIYDYDISKFTIMIRTNMSGVELAEILLNKYNIQVEMAGLNYIVAMTSVADTQKAIMKFAKAIVEIDKKCERIYTEQAKLLPENTAECIMVPRDVFYSKKIKVSFLKAIDRIAGESVIAYPPGIPIVSLGQKITKEHIALILNFAEAGIEVIGADNDKIVVVEE